LFSISPVESSFITLCLLSISRLLVAKRSSVELWRQKSTLSLGGKFRMIKKFGWRFAATLGSLGLATALIATTAGATATLSGDLTFNTSGYSALAPSFGGSTFDEPYLDAALPIYMTEATNDSTSGDAPTGFPLYDGVGSSAGKKGVEAGTFQVGFTDVPLGTDTGLSGNVALDTNLSGSSPALTLSDYIQVPIDLGGVAITYNLPTVTKKFPKTPIILNASVLAQIYTGAITTWNNPAIVKLNPKISTTTVKKNKKGKVISKKTKTDLPSTSIIPVYRADGSGTSFAFMSYLYAQDPSIFSSLSGITSTTAFPGTSWPAILPSNALGAQKSAGVAYDVQETQGSIGYVEYSYLASDSLAAANIVNKAGHAEPVNSTTVAADAASFSSTPPTEGTNGVVGNFSIANGSATNAYPISTYSWAVIPQDFATIGISADSASSTGGLAGETLIAKFFDWAVQDGGGQTVAAKEGYVPLPSYLSALAEKQIATLTYNKTPIVLN
jgi:phosphate transport system substrate-binding protein